jgi:hypothetical protein
VITPLFLALDTPQSPVGEVLLCQAIIDHMNRKLAAPRCEDGNTLNRLAARPYSKLLNGVSRQVCATVLPQRETRGGGLIQRTPA